MAEKREAKKGRTIAAPQDLHDVVKAALLEAQFPGHWFRLMSDAFTSNFSGRHGWRESCSSSEEPPYRQGETMTFIQMRCPYCDGKNVEEQNTYTIKCGAPRTMYHCSSCKRAFSETRNTPIAQLKTPIAIVVQVLAALTEGLVHCHS